MSLSEISNFARERRCRFAPRRRGIYRLLLTASYD
jgi:hypothetical protein